MAHLVGHALVLEGEGRLSHLGAQVPLERRVQIPPCVARVLARPQLVALQAVGDRRLQLGLLGVEHHAARVADALGLRAAEPDRQEAWVGMAAAWVGSAGGLVRRRV